MAEQPTRSEREHQLGEVVAAYLAARDRGEPVDRAALLARHPTLERELTDFFADEDDLAPLVARLRAAPALEGQPLGDYDLLEEIARGGMGVVYRARQRGVGRMVALKVILHGRLATPDDVLRFRAEAEHATALDHPHIVPLYHVGEADGRPFFTMRLIDGGNLAQALADRDWTVAGAGWRWTDRQGGGQWRVATRAGQQAAARLVETVARAVQHAHDRGVIHRDLKPANILLDRGGAPHVTDFGLARSAARPAPSVSGAVVGTLLYMSPEQAQGHHNVTTATDVYALGAILYELLTGRPPFQAAEFLEMLHAIQETEPIAPRQSNAAIHRDLATICLKCLRKEPARRYASAAALAEDLRRFQAGEPVAARAAGQLERMGKWVKRRPAVAALAAALFTAVVVGFGLVTWKWQDALAAQATAEQREQEAQAARMQAEINAQKALQAQRDTEEQRAVAQAHAQQARDAGRAAESQRRVALEQRDLAAQYLAKAQEAVRTMLTTVSESDQGLKNEPRFEPIRKSLLEKALAYYQGFLREPSTDPAVRLAAAAAYRDVGDIYTELASKEQAEQAYRQSLRLLQELGGDRPSDAAFRRELAASCNGLGLLLLATGGLAEAEELLARALALRKGLAADFPDVALIRQDLAQGYNNLALLLDTVGRPDEGEQLYRQARDVEQALFDDFPAMPEYRHRLAESWGNLATVVSAAGRVKEAEPLYDQAIELCQPLTHDFPGVARYRRTLARAFNNLALLLANTRRPEAAAELYRKCLDLRQRLAEDFPAVAAYRQELALSCNNFALLLRDTGQPQDAEKYLRLACEHRRKLLADFPSVAAFRNELAQSTINLGVLLQGAKKLVEAEELQRSARDLYQKLVDDFPNVPGYRRGLAGSCYSLGRLYQLSGRLAAAEEPYRASIFHRQLLAGAFPAVGVLREELAASCNNLGVVLEDLGRLPEAEQLYRQAVALRKQLVLDFPEVGVYHDGLRLSSLNLLDLLKQLDRLADTAPLFRELFWCYHELAERHPGNVGFRWLASQMLQSLGDVHRATGNWNQARAALEHAVKYLERVLREQPGHAQARARLPGAYLGLAEANVQLGRHADAALALDGVTTAAGKDSATWLAAAVQTARCIPVVEQDTGLSPAERQRLAQSYAERAVALLGRAVACGYRDAGALQGHPALAPLRDRTDFQDLIRQLSEPKTSAPGQTLMPRRSLSGG
jgi:serine/threonine-protein kinase